MCCRYLYPITKEKEKATDAQTGEHSFTTYIDALYNLYKGVGWKANQLTD